MIKDDSGDGGHAHKRPEPKILPDQGADHHDPGGEGGQVRPETPAETVREEVTSSGLQGTAIKPRDHPCNGRLVALDAGRARHLDPRQPHDKADEGRSRLRCSAKMCLGQREKGQRLAAEVDVVALQRGESVRDSISAVLGCTEDGSVSLFFGR